MSKRGSHNANITGNRLFQANHTKIEYGAKGKGKNRKIRKVGANSDLKQQSQIGKTILNRKGKKIQKRQLKNRNSDPLKIELVNFFQLQLLVKIPGDRLLNSIFGQLKLLGDTQREKIKLALLKDEEVTDQNYIEKIRSLLSNQLTASRKNQTTKEVKKNVRGSKKTIPSKNSEQVKPVIKITEKNDQKKARGRILCEGIRFMAAAKILRIGVKAIFKVLNERGIENEKLKPTGKMNREMAAILVAYFQSPAFSSVQQK